MPEAPHPALTEVWAQGEGAGAPESAMLEAAALFASARCAGVRAGRRRSETPAADPEPHPPAPPAATALLLQILEGEMRPLLPEWLGRCARSGRVVPPIFLPRLFREVARSERVAFGPVAGARGAWLATQNPEWAWLANPDEPPSLELWETGTPAQRLACLAAVRRRDPALARAWLETSWAAEAPDFRTAGLGVLAEGLSCDDEPLLTRCLGDRRRETRQQAQVLLARLPESAFARRMLTRAGEMLRCKRGLLSRRLEVVLPALFDPTWRVDGIEEKPPAGVGEKAHWVRQVLALVPVGHWLRTFGLAAPELLELAQKSEWNDLLVDAWLRALSLGTEPGLTAALFEPALVRPQPPPVGTQAMEIVAKLFAGCSEAERWGLAARFGGERGIVWWCVPHLGGAPAQAEARRVLRHLAPALRDGSAPGGTPGAVAAARAFPPALHGEAATLFARDNGLSKPAEHFLQALELRAAMHAAFGPPLKPSSTP